MLSIINNAEQYIEISIVGDYPAYHPLAALGLQTEGDLYGVITTRPVGGNVVASFTPDRFTISTEKDFIWRILKDDLDLTQITDTKSPVYCRIDHISPDRFTRFEIYANALFIYRNVGIDDSALPAVISTDILSLTLTLPVSTWAHTG